MKEQIQQQIEQTYNEVCTLLFENNITAEEYEERVFLLYQIEKTITEYVKLGQYVSDTLREEMLTQLNETVKSFFGDYRRNLNSASRYFFAELESIVNGLMPKVLDRKAKVVLLTAVDELSQRYYNTNKKLKEIKEKVKFHTDGQKSLGYPID